MTPSKSLQVYCILLVLLLSYAVTQSKNRKLLKVWGISSEYLVDSLEALDNYGSVQLWTLPRVNGTMDILISYEMYFDLVEYFNELGLAHEVVIEDVNELLDKEKRTVAPLGSALESWDFYYHYDDIVRHFRNERFTKISENLPSLEEFVIGKTILGEDILLYKISQRNTGRSERQKPGIWIDGGIHGLEWISISTVVYIMNKLLHQQKTSAPGNFSGSSNSSCNFQLLDNFDVFFVPVVNVDGYKYTHAKDRFWVKNLSNHTSYKNCLGVNLNRNFGNVLPETKVRITGLGRDPCSDFHYGPHSFSEPETKAISHAIEERKEKIKLYLTFHSYSQQWLLPEDYELTPDYEQLVNLARIGKSALEKTNGLKFSLGNTPPHRQSYLHQSPGKSFQWAKEVAKIKYAYNLQLRDDGKFGYILPAQQIRPTGEETFNGISALSHALAQQLLLQ